MNGEARRATAGALVLAARLSLREAAKHLDGLAPTAHRNCATAMVACEDAMEAIVASDQLARKIEAMEEHERSNH